MTFNFNVHTGTTQAVQAVKEAVKELVKHFEETLKYKVETVLEDSEKFPVHLRAAKKTKVEVRKEVGKEYDKVSLPKYDEQRKNREWDILMCLAIRSNQEEKLSNLIDIEPEGENETKKMLITLEKSMTFNLNVQASTPQVIQTVKDAMKELKDHFEKTLKYNVETILEDSEEFPAHMRAKKKTKVEV